MSVSDHLLEVDERRLHIAPAPADIVDVLLRAGQATCMGGIALREGAAERTNVVFFHTECVKMRVNDVICTAASLAHYHGTHTQEAITRMFSHGPPLHYYWLKGIRGDSGPPIVWSYATCPLLTVHSRTICLFSHLHDLLQVGVIAGVIAGIFERLVGVGVIAGLHERLVGVGVITGIFERLVGVGVIAGLIEQLVGVGVMNDLLE
ncbi:hypothetical protein BKA93DRAFT_753705 [Sparassis latifolia]